MPIKHDEDRPTGVVRRREVADEAGVLAPDPAARFLYGGQQPQTTGEKPGGKARSNDVLQSVMCGSGLVEEHVHENAAPTDRETAPYAERRTPAGGFRRRPV